MEAYRYNRWFWLHHMMQMRSLIRTRHPMASEARSLLKRSQAQAARLRKSAYSRSAA